MKKHLSIIIVFSILFFVSLARVTANDLFNAEIYLQGSEKSELVYNYRNTIEQDGSLLTLRHIYLYPAGGIFAVEEVVLRDGELVKHSTSFPDLEEESLLVKSGEKIDIFFSRKGKEKDKTINLPDDLVFGPTQQDFITENFRLLVDGERVSFTLPVPEFTTTTRFTMKKISSPDYDRPGTIVVEMKSNNILLLFLTKPIQFVLDSKSGRILEIHGTSVLKWKVNDKWEFLNSDIYFNYN